VRIPIDCGVLISQAFPTALRARRPPPTRRCWCWKPPRTRGDRIGSLSDSTGPLASRRWDFPRRRRHWHVSPEQIYDDSLKLTVSPVPTNTLESTVLQSSLKVTLENFVPTSDTAHPELRPIVGPPTSWSEYVEPERYLHRPGRDGLRAAASGVIEQTMIAHVDPTSNNHPPPCRPRADYDLTECLGTIPALAGVGLGTRLGAWARSAGKVERRRSGRAAQGRKDNAERHPCRRPYIKEVRHVCSEGS